MNNKIYLNYIEDLLLDTAKIHSWHLSPSYELIYSNHPTPAPLKNIFSLSTCNTYLKHHFEASISPLLMYDDLFFLWAAIPAYTENEHLINIHLLGPVFSSYTSDNYIKEKMDIQNMSIKSKKELLNLIEQIPVIPTAFFSNYVCQMYYTLNDTIISAGDIKLQNDPVLPNKKEKQPFISSTHTSYYYETLLLKSIQDGIPIPNIAALISSAQVGTMCPGDPLRQKKDEAISLITLFTRTAIQSGIMSEKAYTCSDYYIQSIEAVATVPEVIQLIEVMYLDITRQVHEFTCSNIHNHLVRDCMTYLDMHYKEKVNLDQLADTLGYTKYYISLRFKKETGMSISEYITKQRISYAKTMLDNPYISVQTISDELHFSTPSHFTSVFRKHTGITPTQYRNKKINTIPK